MRFVLAVLLLGGCAADMGDMGPVISGPGTGLCRNTDPALGPVWHFEREDITPHISTAEITETNLIAGDTGLYVSGLQLVGAIMLYSDPITANILPNDGARAFLQGTFGKIPTIPLPARCQWDAIGPYWPDAPQ